MRQNLEDWMNLKTKKRKAFDLRASGRLRVRPNVFVPVTIHIPAGVAGEPALLGHLSGPEDMLREAFCNGEALIEIGGIKLRAPLHGFSGDAKCAFFPTPPLYRALARHAAQTISLGGEPQCATPRN
jgi:hypothetical protein